MAGETWNEREVELVIDPYFSMLELELAGQPFSKTEHREQLQAKVHRSKGSIEYKLQNISAILAELGAAFIDGYKPARNAQQLLRTRVAEVGVQQFHIQPAPRSYRASYVDRG